MLGLISKIFDKEKITPRLETEEEKRQRVNHHHQNLIKKKK